MKTNDLKKGQRIRLRNGWYATVRDNTKGNTRMCEVEGDYTELGSIYSHDILFAVNSPGEPFYITTIEHTPKQDDLREFVNTF